VPPIPPTSPHFLFETAPFLSCHASTIVESRSALVAAWFGGTYEGASDVGIWLSRNTGDRWSPPKEIEQGRDSENKPLPCWNPVLFQPSSGPLLLFYKVGPHPATWWGMMTRSEDGGLTWSKPERLPRGILGPIKNKPVELPDGTLLCPSSDESQGWRVHFEMTRDLGRTWSRTPVVPRGGTEAIQPTILSDGTLNLTALVRTKQGHIYETTSADQGRTWTPLAPTDLPNPDSGIDAVTLRDGRWLLVYNATTKGRSPLNVAVSDPTAEGHTAFRPVLILEDAPGKEFSYPAVIQTADGLVHITYTWHRRRIAQAVIDPTKLR
jgi:predicted neuraminidase